MFFPAQYGLSLPIVLRSGRLATCSSLVSELCERTSALSVLSDLTQRGVSVNLQWLAFKTARQGTGQPCKKGLGEQAGLVVYGPNKVESDSTPFQAPSRLRSLPVTLSQVRDRAASLTNEVSVKPQLLKFSLESAA